MIKKILKSAYCQCKLKLENGRISCGNANFLKFICKALQSPYSNRMMFTKTILLDSGVDKEKTTQTA
ncbi:hypothetical protein [uncultured Campylobacter sp.]|uniref:hypothetical protein n=1 Tax=uncultured Campylobacter sp. TaxID=218934 RepID=UPI00261DC188|nr:hypothetical protein [uncultured Campylobacter sp.]